MFTFAKFIYVFDNYVQSENYEIGKRKFSTPFSVLIFFAGCDSVNWRILKKQYRKPCNNYRKPMIENLNKLQKKTDKIIKFSLPINFK